MDKSSTVVGANQLVRDYAEGFSNQAKLANRTWIALVVLVAYSLQSGVDAEGTLMKDLPFGFGTVPATTIDPLMYFVISAITISFCALMVQTLRVYDMAHSAIDEMADKEFQRPFFDMLTNPTLWRVGPLSLKIETNKKGIKPIVRVVLKTYYYLLRISAGVVMLSIPVFGVIASAKLILARGDAAIEIRIALIVFLLLVGIAVTKTAKSYLQQTMKTGAKIGR